MRAFSPRAIPLANVLPTNRPPDVSISAATQDSVTHTVDIPAATSASEQHTRILALDHFFGQDLDALQLASDPSITIDRIPYQRIYAIAQRHFAPRVFADIRASAEPQYRLSWDSYREEVVRFCDWLLASYRPHLLILPSDTVFYFRPIIEHFRSHGLSIAVVQKETTISPMTMDVDSQYVADSVPFMSDVMTVCSKRHREFWLRQGVDPSKIVVTGQPRFDVYAEPSPTRTSTGRPRLLYFSYDDFAYLPYDGQSTPLGDWTDLRRVTETTLSDLASAGLWEVIAKPHPQQITASNWLRPEVVRAPADADTRELIRSVDVVVGFQTTALFEAALAGKPVIYAAWGPVFDRAHDLLVPFEEYRDLVMHVHSATELREVLTQPSELASTAGRGARDAAILHLGPVDGGASARVLSILGQFVHPYPVVRPHWRLFFRAVVLGLLAPVMTTAAAMLRLARRHDLASAADRRSLRWSQELREASQILKAHPDYPKSPS